MLEWLRKRLGTPTALRRAALATIVANVAIVITGGVVRLTGSGLGCPTWPTCTGDSMVPSPEVGIHGLIENTNRYLGTVVGLITAIAVVSALVQRDRNRRAVRLSLAVLGGVLLQGVVGGITVITGLNPWTVGAHFLASMVCLAVAYPLWLSAKEGDGEFVASVPRPARTLAGLTVAASAAVVIVGTLVTGSGPHAGDPAAGRNGLDPAALTQIHADLVFLLIGLSLGLYLALKAVGGPTRAAVVLLVVEAGQGVIGYAQHLLHVPAVLVGLHMFGACLVWLATVAVWFAPRERVPAGQASRAAMADANR